MGDEAGHDPVADDHVMGCEIPGGELFVDDELGECISASAPGTGQRRRGEAEIREPCRGLFPAGDGVEFGSDLLADRVRALRIGHGGTATCTGQCLLCDSDSPLISGAEHDAGGLRPTQSETGHMLPSETDSTKRVDELLDRVEGEVDPCPGSGRDDQAAFAGADLRVEAACGVPGQGAHLRRSDVHAGDPVLDRLEAADRGPELLADAGVFDRGVRAPLGDA